ncbi:MAG TPA: Crp/Fnr family transcriptional regulator [Turneriella sp.]|nr:Crp/Fnr family transcriptional regulator [Turneriella sp.]
MTSINFAKLNSQKTELLQNISHYKRFAKNENVFEEGDVYRGPYIVVEGQFKVFMLGDAGKESIMHVFREGELLAGGPLFLGGTYPASCASLSDGCLIAFEYDRLKKIIDTDESIHNYFLQRTLKLLPRLKQKIESLALKSAEQRIINYFKSLGADRAPVALDIPKNQIAALLDLTPESVSRVLNQLIQREILSVDEKTYSLKK